jgi:hypothetical protein
MKHPSAQAIAIKKIWRDGEAIASKLSPRLSRRKLTGANPLHGSGVIYTADHHGRV